MLKMALALLSVSFIVSCNSSSSGGGNGGGGGNNPEQKPTGYVGACQQNLQMENGTTAQICTEYYEGQTKITEGELQTACANAGIQFTKTCANNPLLSCRIQQNGFVTILRVYDVPANRDEWAQGCTQNNGQVL